MPIRKSELYSSIWQSCDALRGGMDASQYKDYVLVLLFVKYVSDKYADQDFAPITIPKGASFKDMIALKGKGGIGDEINKKIIGPLYAANKLSDPPDFNDPAKLGSGKEMVDRLTNLITIFENPALDFSNNRADGDDILGDAYEYLMRHFATESGKSKGQFYTPAEVSRVMAKLIGIGSEKISAKTTVYDPTCGSGSLLLKVGDEAKHAKGIKVTLYGQEKDSATSGLARMNMILHDQAGAAIEQGNTLSTPHFTDDSGKLKTFDFVVANPPFSDKRWSTGLDPENDPYGRFVDYGVPPTKQGDYAYLLHIVRSLKSTGKAACILPHGVLFRGNAEGAIRKNLVLKRYIKAIIGLPANLFYGTGIPACIVVIDKEEAEARKGIFMIDASKGFMKDGPKNRLREQDIHKIVDTFERLATVDRYSRMVPLSEISDAKNDFNLNLPRYIDSSEPEDLQDIDAHLHGGIPERDIDALKPYWDVLPGVRSALFKKGDRPGYCELKVPVSEIKSAIFGQTEFTAFTESTKKLFATWKSNNLAALKGIKKGDKPKVLIEKLSENLLACFEKAKLLDAYDVYQHLMDYCAEAMQDDCYLIAADGWVAKPARIIETDKKGMTKDKGWACDLIPKSLIVARYFAKEQAALDAKQAELEAASASLAELEEENGGEEDALGSLDKIAKAEVNARLKEIKGDAEAKDEEAVLKRWLELSESEAALKRVLKESDAALDRLAYEKYAKLTEADIKTLVIDDKWMARLEAALRGELDRVSQTLTGRIRQLAERYAAPLPQILHEIATLSSRVDTHLKKMGAL